MWIFIHLDVVILIQLIARWSLGLLGMLHNTQCMYHITFLKFEEIWFLQYIWPQDFWRKKVCGFIETLTSQDTVGVHEKYQEPSTDTGKDYTGRWPGWEMAEGKMKSLSGRIWEANGPRNKELFLNEWMISFGSQGEKTWGFLRIANFFPVAALSQACWIFGFWEVWDAVRLYLRIGVLG